MVLSISMTPIRIQPPVNTEPARISTTPRLAVRVSRLWAASNSAPQNPQIIPIGPPAATG